MHNTTNPTTPCPAAELARRMSALRDRVDALQEADIASKGCLARSAQLQDAEVLAEHEFDALDELLIVTEPRSAAGVLAVALAVYSRLGLIENNLRCLLEQPRLRQCWQTTVADELARAERAAYALRLAIEHLRPEGEGMSGLLEYFASPWTDPRLDPLAEAAGKAVAA